MTDHPSDTSANPYQSPLGSDPAKSEAIVKMGLARRIPIWIGCLVGMILGGWIFVVVRDAFGFSPRLNPAPPFVFFGSLTVGFLGGAAIGVFISMLLRNNEQPAPFDE